METTSGKFKTAPFNHQLVCLNKFGRREYFALTSEMGTGKSWILINNAADLWSSGDLDSVLIFAPNGVHTNWIRNEIPKHMPDWVDYKMAEWTAAKTKKVQDQFERLYAVGQKRCMRILAMNWESLATKRGVEEATKFANCSGKLMIICDESDCVKDHRASRTKELMKLKKYSAYRRISTGTPFNNSPEDAFSQFSFLDGSILQTDSFYAFKAEYCELMSSESRLIQKIANKKNPWSATELQTIRQNAIEICALIYANAKNNEPLTTAAENILNAASGGDYEDLIDLNMNLRSLFNPNKKSEAKTKCERLMFEVDVIVASHKSKVRATSSSRRMPQIIERDKKTGLPKYKNLEKLSRLIDPHCFRVLKKDCLDLPDKIYQTVYFDITPEQKRIYEKARDECRLAFEGMETPFSKLVAVTKLAQITSGYYLHNESEEPVRIDGENPKLELLKDRVNTIIAAGGKIIIWARFRVEIQDIVKLLKEEGHSVVQYWGDIGKAQRTAAIDDFEAGRAQVFVGNQQAGGTGITLVAADHVIYFSNNFSLRNRLQSEDRAHRIGQTKNVVYINLVAKDTIDEAIVRALLNKQDVANTILKEGEKFLADGLYF